MCTTGAGEEESGTGRTKSFKLDGRLRYRFDATAASEHSGRHRRMSVSSCVDQCQLHRFHVVGLYIDSIPSPPVNAQVISDASNAAAMSIMEAPPEIGNRSPGIWSVCFQGGTFDRVKQRCRLIASCHTCIDHIMCLYRASIQPVEQLHVHDRLATGVRVTFRSTSRRSIACRCPDYRRESSTGCFPPSRMQSEQWRPSPECSAASTSARATASMRHTRY